MRVALTRAPSHSLAQCEVTYLERQPIDIERAERQHESYVRLLRDLGHEVIRLPAEHDLPDAVFVEDPVIVLDEIAVGLRSGAESRRTEVESLMPVLERYRPVHRIEAPGTIDGGDVLRIGRTLHVGRSRRTSDDGIRQLAALVEPFGYMVNAVSMDGCLHLKSGCTYTGREVLIDPDRIDESAFPGLTLLPVPASEPDAADILWLGSSIVIADTFPQTTRLLRERGHAVHPIDVSEFQKAEAGVTCLSVIFEATTRPHHSGAATAD
jgi:dimethylargininase